MKVTFKNLEDLDTLINLSGVPTASARFVLGVTLGPKPDDRGEKSGAGQENRKSEMKAQKLSKDQIQKIILSTLGFIGLIYCYFTFFLGPLNRNREAMIHKMADVEKKTASSKTELKKTASLELQAKEATGRYEALKSTTLDGAPIAWFPPKMRAFFAKYQYRQDHCPPRIKRRFQATADV